MQLKKNGELPQNDGFFTSIEWDEEKLSAHAKSKE